MAFEPTAEIESILLAMWREVGRHLEISESTVAISALLAEHLPIQSLALRSLVPEHRRVRIVAIANKRAALSGPGDLQLTSSDWKQLDRWERQRKSLHKASDPR